MNRTKSTAFKKRQEIQHKLFFKFLKKNKEWGNFLKLHSLHSQDVMYNPLQYLNYSMWDYAYCFFNEGYARFTRLNLQWGQIVDNYKKIKKKDYTIYGK